jgi:hypothetical protein
LTSKKKTKKKIKMTVPKKAPKKIVSKSSAPCPYGQHMVRAHNLTVPPSKKNPDGITILHAHCARNPSRKNLLKLAEIKKLASQFPDDREDPKCKNNFGFRDGNKYDQLIQGWTKYWNNVFKPTTPLDPDIVKALIGSESSFETKPKPTSATAALKARGLGQITEQTRKILMDSKGELKNNLIYLEPNDLDDPNANICAATRWLFQKQKLASNRLGRPASWEESVAEYKSYLKDIISGKNKNPKGMANFKSKLELLKTTRKKCKK